MPEPTEFCAGDTVEWEKSLEDYSAADGWTLNYRLRGPSTYTVAAECVTASGSDWEITIPAATTAGWNEGAYTLYAWVTKAAESFQVGETKLTIKPDFRTQKNPLDNRSHVKKALDAIEAMMEGTASREESSYMISHGGRSRQLSFFPRAELIQLHSYYSGLYKQELQAERISQGKKGGNKINIRFTR